MADNPTIILRDEGIGNSLTPYSNKTNNLAVNNDTKKLGNTTALVVGFISNTVRKVTNNILSRVGSRTGRRAAQTRINNTLKGIDIVGGVLESGAIGFGLAGGAGGLVGVGVGVAKAGIDIGIEIGDYNNQIEIDNLNTANIIQAQVFSGSNKRSVR